MDESLSLVSSNHTYSVLVVPLPPSICRASIFIVFEGGDTTPMKVIPTTTAAMSNISSTASPDDEGAEAASAPKPMVEKMMVVFIFVNLVAAFVAQ